MDMTTKSEKQVEELKASILRVTRSTDSEEEISNLLDQLVAQTKKSVAQSAPPTVQCHPPPAAHSDPACLGLAAFAVTSMLGQMLNFGLMNKGVVAVVGLVFGGTVQLIAGLFEFYTGNGFGFSAFCTYGSFWICFSLVLIAPEYLKVEISENDKACFMLCFLVYTVIMMLVAFRISTVFSLIFITLSVGFAFMAIFHFRNDWKSMHSAGTVMFSIATILAFYLLAVKVFEDVYKAPILPVGRPFTELLTPRRRGFQVVEARTPSTVPMVAITVDKNGR